MRAVSKRVREEAIEGLLVCADGRITQGLLLTTWDVFGRSSAERVAYAAWDATRSVGVDYYELPDGGARFLEAAALLRDGWSPGEPVHLLKRRGAK